MDTWMASGTALKISRLNVQSPSFGRFKVYSVHEESLKKWIKE
jgi:hypothetical protein